MKILITGGTGFLGRHLACGLTGTNNVLLTGRNNKQNQFAKLLTKCDVAPMDVSNINSVRDTVSYFKPDVIIHAAATKFVDLSEVYPMECIDVNITGSQNVARVAIENNVKQVLGISTDKAAPPVRNIYGMSKAAMERMFCLLNGKTDTSFGCVRYGNVAWSTGSVLGIWESNIKNCGVIKTTGPEMYRFFFTVNDACELVSQALSNFDKIAGKTLSVRMKGCQMQRIIDVWCKLTGATWEKIQGRPGEREVEYLVSEAELPFTEEIFDNHFLVYPNHKPENNVKEVIHSGNVTQLTDDEIIELIRRKPIDA